MAIQINDDLRARNEFCTDFNLDLCFMPGKGNFKYQVVGIRSQPFNKKTTRVGVESTLLSFDLDRDYDTSDAAVTIYWMLSNLNSSIFRSRRA